MHRDSTPCTRRQPRQGRSESWNHHYYLTILFVYQKKVSNHAPIRGVKIIIQGNKPQQIILDTDKISCYQYYSCNTMAISSNNYMFLVKLRKHRSLLIEIVILDILFNCLLI